MCNEVRLGYVYIDHCFRIYRFQKQMMMMMMMMMLMML